MKQTDKKTVVLTTSAQTADVEYTVTVDGEAIGKFKGVSAVIPTTVTMVDRSIQGVNGKEVTVKAQVTVPEGQSKAGIPVTFYVAGSADGLVPAITTEAVTNADGVATYSYTRYVAGDDVVTAYSTGDRSKFQTATVHWGVATQLVIEEVTTGATIQNGSNKTYKVKYVNPVTGKAESGKSLNVAFVENIGVTADKVVTTATVNNVNPREVANTTTVAANVVTDSNGEAIFTVSGTNAKVTPVVYEANGTATTPVTQVAYSSTVLQAKAAPVTFSAKQLDNVLTITGEGTKDATIGASNARKFTVEVKDKDGKAVANQVVKVSLQEKIDNVIGTDSPAYFVTFNADGTVASTQSVTLGNPHSVVTDSNGKATFYLASNNNAEYGTPVAWIDINTSNAYANNVLEQTEPNAVGETTYFWTEKLVSSKLLVRNNTSNLEASSVVANATNAIARYEFQLTNQSGKAITNPSTYVTAIEARYNVNNSGAGAVAVFNNATDAENFRNAVAGLVASNTATPANIIAAVPAGGKYISANNADYLDVNAVNNALYVVSADFSKTTNVSVTASATATDRVAAGATQTYKTLVVAEAKTVTLVSATAVGVTEVGKLKSYNTTNSTFVITTSGGIDKTVRYAGEAGKTYKFVGLNGQSYTATQFIDLVNTNNGANITYNVSGETVTFSINTFGGGAPTDTVAVNTAAAAAAAAFTAPAYNGTDASITVPNTFLHGGITYTVTWTEQADTSNVVTGIAGTTATITRDTTDNTDDTFELKATLTDSVTGATASTVFSYTAKEAKAPTATVNGAGNTATGFTITADEAGTTVAITAGSSLTGGETASVTGNVFAVTGAGATAGDTFEFTVTDATGNVTTYDATYAVATGWVILAQ